jgi:hypothetical protein
MPGRVALLVPGLVACLALAGCGSGGAVPTPLTAEYPAAASGEKALPISLIDQTGLVTALAVAPDAPEGQGVESVPGSETSLRVRWDGDPCDDHVTMVLVDIGATYQLTIHDHPQFAAGLTCPNVVAHRSVDIGFSSHLDATDLSLSIQFP